MRLLDLFAMAQQNTNALANACGEHSEVIVEFAQWISREGKLSVTMKLMRLQTFLDGGKYLNPWDETHRDAHGDPSKAEELMRERQGSWYHRRALFDGRFVDGKKFCYGALYVDGRSLITAKYGPFAAVFRLDAAASWARMAWVPENSLERYVPSDVDFDIDKLRREVGPHASRHYVAAIKHAVDVESWRRDDWGMRLCRHDTDADRDVFVEGIVADDLLVAHIERVLVDRGSWREMLKANAKCLAGTETAEERARASQYRTLKDLLALRNLLDTLQQV